MYLHDTRHVQSRHSERLHWPTTDQPIDRPVSAPGIFRELRSTLSKNFLWAARGAQNVRRLSLRLQPDRGRAPPEQQAFVQKQSFTATEQMRYQVCQHRRL